MATEITYKCEECGNDFISHRVRKGVLLCKTCVEARRAKGQGPVQLAKAGGAPVVVAPVPQAQPKAKARAEAKKEEPKAKGAEVVAEAKVEAVQSGPGTSLAELAAKLREKHAKKAEG